jgi:hypothetical protein
MPLYHAQTTIGVVSNLTADYAVNNTYWIDGDASRLDEVVAELKASYDLWRPEMSSLVRQTNHVTKFYDLEDPEPRAPVYQQTWALAVAPALQAVPPEVSLCVSFQGDQVSGQPQARRRGRNYLPFVGSTSVGADGRPDAACVASALAWGSNLLDYSLVPGNPTWVVNSTFGVPLEFTVEITNVWVDNEFDTQRSRGRDATTRSVYP